MVENGLFDRLPCDAILGLHNTLGQSLGRIGLRDGAMVASSDTLHTEVKGIGGHDTVPEHTVDATLVACHITLALQSIVLWNITPFEPAVAIVGSIQVGHALNIADDYVLMKSMVHILNKQAREIVLQWIHDIAVAQAESLNATTTLTCINGSPVLRNDPAVNAVVREVVTSLFGAEQVGEVKPFMGSEDFALMLEQHPHGSYFITSVGDESGRCMIHNPGYDFNDVLLLTGAVSWCGLVGYYLR